MYFWVRITKNLQYRRLFLFFGDQGDYDYFYSRQGYPCWFSETPHGQPPWWTLHEQSGTTKFEKKTEAKAAAIAAAKTAGWVVVEETYETQAFYNA